MRKTLGTFIADGTHDTATIDGAAYSVSYDKEIATALSVAPTNYGRTRDNPALLQWLGVDLKTPTAMNGRSVLGRLDKAGVLEAYDATADLAAARRDLAAAKRETDKMEAALAADLAKKQKVGRAEFVSRLDTALLADGVSADLQQDGTVLRMQWVGCSRAFVYNLCKRCVNPTSERTTLGPIECFRTTKAKP